MRLSVHKQSGLLFGWVMLYASKYLRKLTEKESTFFTKVGQFQ